MIANLFLNRRKLAAVLTIQLLLLPLFSNLAAAQTQARKAEKQARQESQKIGGAPRDPGKKVAPDLREQVEKASFAGQLANQKVRVIVKMNDLAPNSLMNDKVGKLKGKVNKSYDNLRLVTVEVPLSRIQDLEKDGDIDYLSPDRAVAAAGHVENTSGAAQSRALVTGTTSDGRGVGVAVLDSGMDVNHKLLKTSTGRPGVIFQKDFTASPEDPKDYYGHGSHVGTVIFGGTLANSAYKGVAPAANVLNLKVLDSQGRGNVSNVLAALDWCIANRDAYNIRVINMSLGTPAKDSFWDDPLCQATQWAHYSNILVVASAGNYGKDNAGGKYYGGISSPGIDPSVLTVGALNTHGTDARSDDTIASFSSRGPTRGYYEYWGIRTYDNLIKPEIVAPGNKIIGARSACLQGTNNLLISKPSLATGSAINADEKVMYLSGTSVAAPVVAGTAALLFQINPSLTPTAAKAILMYSAQPLKNVSNFEQGSGALNVDGAARIAKLVKTNVNQLYNGNTMLTAALPSAQTSTIAGQTCYWGQGVITNHCFLYGSHLMTYFQGAYGAGWWMWDATNSNGIIMVRNTNMTTSGVLLFRGALTVSPTGTLLADGTLLSEGTMLADGTLLSEGTLLADGTLLSEGTLLADGYAMAASALLGDNTSAMQPE